MITLSTLISFRRTVPLKRQPSLHLIKPFQRLTTQKLALEDQSSARRKVCSEALMYRISLNWLRRYNIDHRNWHPATTTYRMLLPCYKTIADSEDFRLLIAARYKPVCSCDRKFANMVQIKSENMNLTKSPSLSFCRLKLL